MNTFPPICWPGTTIPKSTDNGFTLGFGETPWYAPSTTKKIKVVTRKKGGFGANNGTIPGLGEK